MVRLSRFPLPLLLAGGLTLFAGLCWELVRQTRTQARVADQILADHSRAAAWRFATAYVADINLLLGPAFGGLTTTPLPPDPLEQLRRSARVVLPCDDPLIDDQRVYFFRALPDGPVETWRGQSADQRLRYYLDSLSSMAPSSGDGFLVKGFRRVSGPTRLLVTHPVFDAQGRPVALLGFETCRAGLDRMFADVFRYADLLPPFLTKGHPAAELLSVAVTRSGTGDTIFATSPRYSAHPARQASLGILGLDYEVALNPDKTSLLLAGMPPSRVPQVMALLLLTAVLLSVTSGLLIRERSLIRARSDFLASVSHELRTPLSQVLLFAETLRQGNARTEPERELAVEVIDQEARRLLHLVQNVLYLTQANRENRKLVVTSRLLAPLVRDVVAAYAPLAHDKAVAFRVQVDERQTARFNPDATRQVLINLLDNAVKFGPDGQEVSITAASHNGAVDLIVQDQGKGVPREHRSRIWRPFYRAHANTNDAPGSGIGLAIVADLTSRQGGAVHYEPGQSGGARFVVTLPAGDREGDE